MIIIPADHNGPPGSGHGGVAAGRLAELVDPRQASVRLEAPIPLGKPLRPVRNQELAAVDVVAGKVLVASVSPWPEGRDVTPVPPLETELIEAAERHWSDEMPAAHPFPTCFGCGPLRSAGSGLGLRPGPVAGRGCHASMWEPGVAGGVPAWLVWAALDCPSGAAALGAVDVAGGETIVTGTLAVDIRRPVSGEGRHRVVSRLVRRQGRRLYTEVALYDDRGHALAIGAATWFAVARASFDSAGRVAG